MTMSAPRLHAYGRAVSTAFGLVGNDENALSFALAFTLNRAPDLLGDLLRAAGIANWRREWSHDARIDVQRYRAGGITDVEIHVPGRLTLVIEAKVGMAVPAIEQCQRYLDRFADRPEPRQRLLVLTECDPRAAITHYRQCDSELGAVLAGMSWTELIAMCVRLYSRWGADTEPGRWIRAFHRFLDQEYQMKAYTDEVWIVPAAENPLWPGGMSFYDTHVDGRIYYRRDSAQKRPLYIALRCRSQVAHIQKVLAVSHEARAVDHLPVLAKVDDTWPHERLTIWHLSAPTPLPHPVPTGDASMRARHCSCDLDVLLSSATVREVEQRMKQRREGEVTAGA